MRRRYTHFSLCDVRNVKRETFPRRNRAYSRAFCVENIWEETERRLHVLMGNCGKYNCALSEATQFRPAYIDSPLAHVPDVYVGGVSRNSIIPPQPERESSIVAIAERACIYRHYKVASPGHKVILPHPPSPPELLSHRLCTLPILDPFHFCYCFSIYTLTMTFFLYISSLFFATLWWWFNYFYCVFIIFCFKLRLKLETLCIFINNNDYIFWEFIGRM